MVVCTFGVAHPLLELENRLGLLDRAGIEGMAQVVEAQAAQSGAVEGGLVGGAHIFGVQVPARRAGPARAGADSPGECRISAADRPSLPSPGRDPPRKAGVTRSGHAAASHESLALQTPAPEVSRLPGP
jgi:hypothetical protein